MQKRVNEGEVFGEGNIKSEAPVGRPEGTRGYTEPRESNQIGERKTPFRKR